MAIFLIWILARRRLPVSTTFQFDELNRLKKVISPDNKTIDYTFDAAGNRLSETKATSGVTTETTSYTYNDQNRLLSTETITASTGNSLKKVYSYDNNGNMVYNTTEEAIVYEDSKTISIGFLKLGIETDTLSCKATLFTYDDFNHLIKAVAGTQTYTYTYNGENRQIAKTNGTNVIKYLYEGDKVILETNAAGTETGRYVYGNYIIERKEGSTAAYYLFNGNNDVVKLVNSSGVSLNSYGYDSFGNMTNLIPPTFNNYIYSAGQTYDSGTGLYYGEEGLHDPTTDYTCRSQYFTPQEDGIYYGGSTATPYMTQQGEPYKETVPTGEGGPAPKIELPNPEFKAVEEDTKGTGNVTPGVEPSISFEDVLNYGIENGLLGDYDPETLMQEYNEFISSGGINNGGSEIGLIDTNDDSNKAKTANFNSSIPPYKEPSIKDVIEHLWDFIKKKHIDTTTTCENGSTIIDRLTNDTSLGLSGDKKAAMINIADTLLKQGYEPEFVAGILGNILAEGSPGNFESSAYISNPSAEPPYLKYMDKYHDYRNVFSGKNISKVGIKKTYSVLKELEKNGYKGKFGLGSVQWTGSRTMELIECYIQLYGEDYYPTIAESLIAENMMIVKELNGSFNYVYQNWKTKYGKNKGAGAAYYAGRVICYQYEVPDHTSTQANIRGKNAKKIYKVMMAK